MFRCVLFFDDGDFYLHNLWRCAGNFPIVMSIFLYVYRVYQHSLITFVICTWKKSNNFMKISTNLIWIGGVFSKAHRSRMNLIKGVFFVFYHFWGIGGGEGWDISNFSKFHSVPFSWILTDKLCTDYQKILIFDSFNFRYFRNLWEAKKLQFL